MGVEKTNVVNAKLGVSADALDEFCRRWRIKELALFGSILRSDFGPDSDVDILVTFEEHAGWSLLDHVRIQDELSKLVGRRVDLVSRKGIERSRNYIRRKAILESSEVIYAAA